MKYIKKFAEIFEGNTEENQWWKEFTKYKLSAYPVNIPKEDVTIDLSGDINTHPVLTWNSPTTGKKVYSYTKERTDAQRNEKYERVEKMSEEQVEKIKAVCHDIIIDTNSSESDKQAAAVVSIIAQTGLRPGSKKGFSVTHNRGVSTLAVENVIIKGSIIKLDFTGKSYEHNTAEFEDGTVAHYLENKIKKQKKSDFVFDISSEKVESFMKDLPEMNHFKVKDLRTHIAGKVAKDFLSNDPLPPPPVPNDPKEIKKAVTIKLKKAFETVSHQLNNTPAMAKKSYVSPVIINKWLNDIGVKIETTVTEKYKQQKDNDGEHIVGNAVVYNLPDWWESDDVELVKA
mgnify:CR=1 FL=1